MSKERLEETDFEEIWKPVKSVIEYYRMDYGEAVTIGGQFGVLKREIKLLQQQNKRYRERVAQLINYIEMTDDDVDQQVHKIHVILDKTLEGEE